MGTRAGRGWGVSVDVRDFAAYDPDARTIEVAIVPSGLPRLTSLFPCPGGTETERQQRVAEVRRAAWFSGYYIVEERRVRNEAFDRRGEKTTTRFVVRPCRNEDEAAAVIANIQAGLDELARAARPTPDER